MMIDLHKLPSGQAFQADLCIVGGGIAGLVLAHALLDSQLQILLLEAGGCSDEAASQELTDAEISGWPYRGSSEGRFRLLGGSSTRWGGQLLPLMPHDFAPRAHVPQSGWPIDGTCVAPYLERIETLMGVDHSPYDRSRSGCRQSVVLRSAADALQVRCSKWAPFRRRNLARTLGQRLAAHPRVRVLLHANVTAIRCRDHGRVSGVEARTLGGAHCSVEAKRLVLCCGTIETVRLLLASARGDLQGILQQGDLLGRYFHDHLSVPLCPLEGKARRFCLDHFAPWYRGRTRHSPKLEASIDWQQSSGSLNTMAHLVFATPQGTTLAWARQQLQRIQGHPGDALESIAVRGVLRDSVDLAELAWRRVLQQRRWAPRSAPLVLTIDSEQAPDPCSRIMLSARRNALGEPLARVHWHWGAAERHSIESFAGLLDQQWQRWGLGRLHLAPAWEQLVTDTLHPMGGTRMARSPRQGVVDEQLRVHGTSNLYIASCSVFPTGGSSNPTLTLMALCLRLADHLRRNP